MEREEKPLKEWIEAAQLTLCRSRVVIGQPTKVKGEGLNKNFMVYPVVLETVRPQAPLSPASAAKVERNSEADDDDDDTVDRQVAKRRFSEFEELRATLARRFGAHGMLVPSLPPKKGFGTGDKVVRRRVRALALFCAAILENCFLAEDSAWVAFARGAGGGDAHALGKARGARRPRRRAPGGPGAYDGFAKALGAAAAAAAVRAATSAWADAEAADGAAFAARRAGRGLGRAAHAGRLPAAAQRGAPGGAGRARRAARGFAAAALGALARRTLAPLPDALRAWLCDVVSYELSQASALRDARPSRTWTRRRGRGGEAARRGGSPEARDLAQVHEAREKHARDFRCGLVAWSLPKFADRRSRVLNVFAAPRRARRGAPRRARAAGRRRARPARLRRRDGDPRGPRPRRARREPLPARAYRAGPRPPPPPAGIEERKSIDEGRGRKSENEVAV
ncbi:hypothetical protein JL722_10371 [Aureococcus anophagefferens]|nr:hypothetical protein JL722_10371 [Aureococcus anophagefferens]